MKNNLISKLLIDTFASAARSAINYHNENSLYDNEAYAIMYDKYLEKINDIEKIYNYNLITLSPSKNTQTKQYLDVAKKHLTELQNKNPEINIATQIYSIQANLNMAVIAAEKIKTKKAKKWKM